MIPEQDLEGEQRPYSGRWVAELRGKIIAQGGTPKQAQQAALKSRYKEKPEIKFMKDPRDYHLPPIFKEIQKILKDKEGVFLVGGAVRDSFLGRTSHDLDFAVNNGAIKLARKVANALDAAFYPLDNQRDAGRILLQREDGLKQVIDFAAFRGNDLEEDLRARDFTINAMAIDLKDLSLYDPLGGVADLREKKLSACSSSSFLDDPLRILRAIRLAAAYDLHILPDTRLLIKEAVIYLPSLSSERLRDELFRILQGPKPAVCLKSLDILSALVYLLPELQNLKGVPQSSPHVQDVWSHSLSILSHLESILAALSEDYNPETASNYFHGTMVMKIGRYRKQISQHLSQVPKIDRSWREVLLFSGLYHDIAKPIKAIPGQDGHIRYWGHEIDSADLASTRARFLSLSNEEVDRIQIIVKNHMRLHYHTNRLIIQNKLPTKKAIYRFFRDTGEAGVDVCLLTLADLWATYENTLPEDTWIACLDIVRIFLEAWWEKRSQLVEPPRLLTGEDILKSLEIEPGPKVGILLEAVREAQITQGIQDFQTAIDYAREYGENLLRGNIKEFVQVDNIKLAYFLRPGRGSHLLLLHGYPLDHSIWLPMLPYLHKNLSILMPDIPGFGLSETSDQIDSMEKYADILAGMLDSLRIKTVFMAGHSMGGYIALAFAAKYPQRLSGLGLLASRTIADTTIQKESRQKMIREIQKSGMKPVADSMVEKLTAFSDADTYLQRLIEKSDPNGSVNALKAMISRHDTSDVIRYLQIPILLLAGDKDALIPIQDSRQLHLEIPNIEYLELQNVGHSPMLEAPEETSQAINTLTGLSRETKI